MADAYQIKKQEAAYYLKLQVVEWIDVFSRFIYTDILLESLDFCIKNKGLRLYSYVIMSNHVHLLVQAKEGYKLSEIIRDFKSFTSKAILKNIGKS